MSYNRDIGEMWFHLGASGRVSNAMGRNQITPEAAKRMTDTELLKLRNLGKTAISEVRSLLQNKAIADTRRLMDYDHNLDDDRCYRIINGSLIPEGVDIAIPIHHRIEQCPCECHDKDYR